MIISTTGGLTPAIQHALAYRQYVCQFDRVDPAASLAHVEFDIVLANLV